VHPEQSDLRCRHYGGGHNGLTAAAYLARGTLDAGSRTPRHCRWLLRNRRDFTGCRASTTSISPVCFAESSVTPSRRARTPHGSCDPALQVPFPDGHWSPGGRTRSGRSRMRKISPKMPQRLFASTIDSRDWLVISSRFFSNPPEQHAIVRGCQTCFAPENASAEFPPPRFPSSFYS